MAEPSYKTKVEYVADYIREGIIAGRFPRKAKLKQTDIADSLDISPTPVREALRLLEAEGFVQGGSHRGAVVAPFEQHLAREILELRVLLEGRLTLAAIRRMTPEVLRDLTRLQSEFEQAVSTGDRYSVRATNYRFHRRLYTTADQPQTLSFVNILWAKYPFDLINRIPNRMQNAANEHAELLTAIGRHDEVAAINMLTEHVHAGWDELEAAMAEESGSDDQPAAER